MRQQRSPLVQHLQGQLVTRTEADFRGHSGPLPPSFATGPLFGQVEADIDQGVLAEGDVAEVDPNLAVVDLAQPCWGGPTAAP
jgi:hypothetical protein